MKAIKLFLLLYSLIIIFPSSLMAMDQTKPQMLGDQYYKEYWEQTFIFDDGTFVTSQFLVANFPWPVGKKHGIMIATVVRPDGQRLIIKNGRNFGGWGFNPKKFNIFIYTHRLSKKGDKDVIHLGTAGQDVINITGKSTIAPLDDKRFKSGDGYMESSFYLPYFNGTGRWKIRWDKKQPFMTGAGRVQGFATHVLFTGRVETLLKSWLRVRGLRQKNNQPVPFLSSIQHPDGTRNIIFTLKNPNGKLIRFSNITLKYKDIKPGKNKSSFPTVFVITASNNGGKLIGTIKFSRKIDYFNINDHLNFFERSFAKSRASVTNYRYIADYDMTYSTAHGSEKLTGKALGEYQDVLSPPRKKRRHRRGRR